jgi:hypothetical protein
MIIMNTSYQEEHQDHHSRNHYDGNESTTTTALNATGAGAVTPTLPPFSDSSANSSPSGKGVNTSPLSTTSTLKRITPERDETTDEPKRRRVMVCNNPQFWCILN